MKLESLLQALRRIPKRNKGSQFPWESAPVISDISAADRAIIEQASPYTMTGPERLFALIQSVRYVVKRNIPGAFAECGVWRGGSVLAMILTLREMNVSDREIYLYDTFEGMTEPTPVDLSQYEPPALETWKRLSGSGTNWEALSDPALFSRDAVTRVLRNTGYPEGRLHLVPGAVEKTLPAAAPPELALLRLDTDWYESTRHELVHLYPNLSHGGVLIIDDYGHWEGCRRAVDEYFSGNDAPPILLNRIDYTGRIGIKA